MPAYVTPAVAATRATLLTRVRKIAGDPSTDAQVQRHTNAETYSAIDDQIAYMWAEWTQKTLGAHLTSTTLAVVASAVPTALPAGLEANAISHVEDYSDTASPILLDWLPPADIDRTNTVQGWCLLGNAIALRPQPDVSKTLRIWYVKDFARLSLAADGDQHNMPISHEECIVQGAAKRLMLIDSEWTTDHEKHYKDIWDAFTKAARRYRGRQYVHNVRKFC